MRGKAPRRECSPLRLVFALSLIAVCALLLYRPVYSVLYPAHYAKSQAKPPQWKRKKVQLLNSCDLQLEHPPIVGEEHPSRLFVFVQNEQSRLILSTLLRNAGHCDAVESKLVVFLDGVSDMPSKVRPSELLLVLYEHPVDLHLAAIQSAAGVECSCASALRPSDKGQFEACYSGVLSKPHCEHMFQLPSEDMAVVKRWQELVSKTVRSRESSEQLLVLDGSRLPFSMRVLAAALPWFFRGADEVLKVPVKRDRELHIPFTMLSHMLEKNLFSNKAVLQFYDEFMATQFWKAVAAAGYSVERNRYCY